MQKLLFIDCCIRKDMSRTKKLADYFLDKIKDRYKIEHLSLMDEPLTYLSEERLHERDSLLLEGKLDDPRFKYAKQFAEADKIVIAAPFWDLSIPALLKIYIENICVSGITFKTDCSGMYGLCKASDLVFITTRGAFYNNSASETGTVYIRAMSEFWGIKNFSCIFADGLDLGLKSEEEILKEAKLKANSIAEKF